MKRLLTFLLTALLILSVISFTVLNVNASLGSLGDVYEEGDFVYVVPSGTNEAILAYVGNVTDTVVIPSTLGGYPVTGINDFTFAGCENLKSLVIPDGIRDIGVNIVSGTALYNDESNWKNGFLYIGDYLIEASKDLTGNCEIRPGTKVIADSAFSGCEKIKSVKIPDGITMIAGNTFSRCTSLVSVDIPDSVTEIGDSAFAECTSLKSIDIPSSVKSIGHYSFANCTTLSSVNLPDDLMKMDRFSFFDTPLYNDESNRENGALYIDNYFIELNDDVAGSYAVKPGTTLIADDAFFFCGQLTSVEIPDSVKYIGEGAFNASGVYYDSNNWEKGLLYVDNCLIVAKTSLFGKCEIKSGTRLIADSAFAEITNLTSVVIPDSIASIGCNAFGYCPSLKAVVVPESVTSIADDAFGYCASLVMYGYSDSFAENYAKEKGIPFEDIEDHTHIFGEWEVLKAATTKTTGTDIRKCLVCNTEETREVPMLVNNNNDIPASSWYTEATLWCVSRGYMSGTDKGQFSPSMNLTRAQFVLILAKIAGADLDLYDFGDEARSFGYFDDVPVGKWYAAAVFWAVDIGVTGGVGDGKFAPDAEVTRAQLAVFLRTYADKKGIDTTSSADITGYADYKNVPDWAKKALEWAVDIDLISGTDKMHLSPNAVATRAQASLIIKKFCENVK